MARRASGGITRALSACGVVGGPNPLMVEAELLERTGQSREHFIASDLGEFAAVLARRPHQAR